MLFSSLEEGAALTALLRGLGLLDDLSGCSSSCITGAMKRCGAVKLVLDKMEMETLECKLAMSRANGSTHASAKGKWKTREAESQQETI